MFDFPRFSLKNTNKVDLAICAKKNGFDAVHDTVYEMARDKAYHSYQHRLVNAYNTADENFKELRIYRAAAQYGQEFNNYTGGEYDFCSYYYQYCETDARDYAEDAV